MAIYSWINAKSGSWNTATNWSPAGGPTNDAMQYFPFSGTSIDTALFATGSSKPYSVRGSGLAQNVTVTGDKVTFRNFSIANDYNGVFLTVNGGADVTVAAGSVFDLTGNFYNADDGDLKLDHAELTVHGTLKNGFLQIGANGLLRVAGPSATVVGISEHDLFYGGDVDATATIDISGGGHLTNTFFNMNGTIAISGAGSTFSTNTLSYESETTATGRIVGSNGATLAGQLTNDGVVEARQGTFHVTAAVVNNIVQTTSTGTFQIDPHAVLDLGASSDQAVHFLTNATLTLEQGVSETGLLRAFSVHDAIDLVGQSVSSFATAVVAGVTTLTAYVGSNAADVLKFSGDYAASNFLTHGDGHGGSLISYQAHAQV